MFSAYARPNYSRAWDSLASRDGEIEKGLGWIWCNSDYAGQLFARTKILGSYASGDDNSRDYSDLQRDHHL